MKTKTCLQCNAPFEALNWQHRFCSPSCRVQWHNSAQVEATPNRTCTVCGTRFHGSNQKRCGDCIEKARNAPCIQCGKPFYRRNEAMRFCSPACRAASKAEGRRTRAVTTHTCAICGTEFDGYSNRRFCSAECRGESIRRSHRHSLERKNCPGCGTEFEAAARQRYCSSECRERSRKEHQQRRRYETDPDYEYPDRAWRRYVAELSAHKCADCGKTSDEVGSLHAHHLLPRSRGGKNTIRNGVFLCKECHRARHDLGIDQQFVEQVARRVVELLQEGK